MRETRVIMGMPISIEICHENVTNTFLEKIFAYFASIDERFSTYKHESEISKINRGEIPEEQFSEEMKEIFSFAEMTKKETNGYFDIMTPEGAIDPSGLVKGYAIYHAAKLISEEGYQNYYVEGGGDIESRGNNAHGIPWQVGIKDPFHEEHIVKIISPRGCGVATSGTYIRGKHIYDPHRGSREINDVVSLTVIGPNVYEADRFATAAFAMGSRGIEFIEQMPLLEGYSISLNGIGTMTSGFEKYVV